METETGIQLLAIVFFFFSVAITCKFAAILFEKEQEHYNAGVWMSTVFWTMTAILGGWLS